MQYLIVLMITFLYDILFFIGHKRPPESGSVNQDYGSADPDPKEIYSRIPN